MARRTTRREFLAATLLAGQGLVSGFTSGARGDTPGARGATSGAPGVTSGARGFSRAVEPPREQDVWKTADAIVARIAPPRFPERTFDVTRFGATRTDDATQAFRAAIDACAHAGGGRVTVPNGRFETGAIRLRSRVRLHLEDGATIAFSRNPETATSHWS